MAWKTGLDGKIRDDRGRVTPWVPQPGRKYLNTKTNEIITRRQFDKLSGRVIGSNEQKAARNKRDNAIAQLMRPARGRKKATSIDEVITRSSRKTVKLKKIRPQLLKTGHRAERIPFNDYEDYLFLLQEAQNEKTNTSRRLITSYAIGISGFSDSTGREVDALLTTLSSPFDVISEEKFNEMVLEFIETHIYFVFEDFFMHLHFDREYAESRVKKANLKNLKKGKK